MNNITVVGNLTADAEVKTFGDSKFIAMKIADNVYQGKDKDDHVNYYDILYGNSSADKMVSAYKKGTQVTVIGQVKAMLNESGGKHYMNLGIRSYNVSLPPKENNGGSDKTLDDEIPF